MTTLQLCVSVRSQRRCRGRVRPHVVGIARLCLGRERLGDIELLPLEAELMSLAKYRNRLLLGLSKADRALLTPTFQNTESSQLSRNPQMIKLKPV
jgi:hypothetical protein